MSVITFNIANSFPVGQSTIKIIPYFSYQRLAAWSALDKCQRLAGLAEGLFRNFYFKMNSLFRTLGCTAPEEGKRSVGRLVRWQKQSFLSTAAWLSHGLTEERNGAVACEWGDSPGRRAWGKIASMTLPQRINRYLRSASVGFFHPQKMSPNSGKVKYKKHS